MNSRKRNAVDVLRHTTFNKQFSLVMPPCPILGYGIPWNLFSAEFTNGKLSTPWSTAIFQTEWFPAIEEASLFRRYWGWVGAACWVFSTHSKWFVCMHRHWNTERAFLDTPPSFLPALHSCRKIHLKDGRSQTTPRGRFELPAPRESLCSAFKHHDAITAIHGIVIKVPWLSPTLCSGGQGLYYSWRHGLPLGRTLPASPL